MRHTMILAGLAIVLATGAARAGDTLSTETVLAPADAGQSGFYPGGKDAYYPGAAFGKDAYLVVWQAGRMQDGDIVGCRVGKDGKVLDQKPFAVSAAKDDQEQPHVAFGGGVFLVVWSDLRNEKDYDVYAARVTPEGKVLDAEGILVSGGAHNQCRPRLAFDGENFVVAWMDFRNGGYQVYFARVSADGKVLDPDGVALAKGGSTEPAVASPGGGRALVAARFPANPTRDGFGGVFVQGGKPAEGVAPHLPGAKPDFFPWAMNSHRSVAAGKNGYLVAYQNYSPAGRAGIQYKADCLLVHPDGSREPFQSLSGESHRTVSPDVVWDGAAYVAAWHDPTNNQRGGDIDVGKGVYSRLYASRLDENGKPLTPAGQPIFVSGTAESPAQRPALATDGAGTTLVAYEKHPDKSDVPIKIAFRILTTK